MSNRSLALPILVAALATIAACAPKQNVSTTAQQLTWAHAALERNPQLEVVATDTNAATFTVKHRSTGRVSVVSLDKLAAAPIADLTASAAPAATPPPVEIPAPAPSEPAAAPPAATVASAPPSEAAPPAETPPAATSSDQGYTIQREGGQLRVSGPGVSIVSASSASPKNPSPTAVAISETPIVCEGGQFMHLDRRNIRVNGTAVIARNGCELHITNSTIESSGTAISVQDATVNISNSDVTGKVASIEANGKARLYARSSTFHGITRRNDPAELNDQGGNTWR
jgi:hypothetical protein